MKSITKKYVISLIFIFLGTISLGFYLKNIEFDYTIMKILKSNNFLISNEYLLNFFKFITILGNEKTYFILLPIIFIYLYYKKLKKEIIILFLAIIFSYILNESIKYIVLRPRPVDFFVIYMKGYSFPSVHAMNTASFYFTFAYILKEKLKFKNIYKIIYILFFFVAISRIILRVHFVSDVLVGTFLGVFISCLFIHIYNNYWRN